MSTTLLTVLRAGDHLLAQDCLYGGTHDFVTHDFPALGFGSISSTPTGPESWEAKLRPETRAIYVETMTQSAARGRRSRAAVVAFARRARSGLDHRQHVREPGELPAARARLRSLDPQLHEVPERPRRHRRGRGDRPRRARRGDQRASSATSAARSTRTRPSCLHRGMKTLALRVRQQNESALEIARFLEGHPAIARVNYPGLESHPRHARARDLFDGFGGMLSFELAGGAGGRRAPARSRSSCRSRRRASAASKRSSPVRRRRRTPALARGPGAGSASATGSSASPSESRRPRT